MRQVRGVGHVWALALVLDLGIVTIVRVVKAITFNEDHLQLGGNLAGFSLFRPVRGNTVSIKDNGGIPATRGAVGGFRGPCVLTCNPTCHFRCGL